MSIFAEEPYIPKKSKAKTMEEKLWENIDKKGKDECWIWTGGTNNSNYGRFKYKKVLISPYREMYRMKYGDIEKGKLIKHKCGNTLCVNPEHLRLGYSNISNTENINISSLEEELWKNIDKKDDNECWEWLGCKNNGYGICFYKGIPLRTHREVYIIKRGNIPEGLLVRHKCDNPSCCNPNHLELGTNADNQLDASKRGRHGKGIILSEDKILTIYNMANSGLTKKEISKKLGYTKSQVNGAFNIREINNRYNRKRHLD